MKNNSIIRMKSLRLNNFKNVANGLVSVDEEPYNNGSYDHADVLGIYGQNGSGKTAVVDALYFIQRLLRGEKLSDNNDEFEDYMSGGAEESSITVNLSIYGAENIRTDVIYSVTVKRVNGKTVISRETLSRARSGEGIKAIMAPCVSFDIDQDNELFTPQIRLQELVKSNKNKKTDLMVAKKLAAINGTSYIFSEESFKVFTDEVGTDFEEYATIIKELKRYAIRNLFVIRNVHSGYISAKMMLPIAFKYETESVGKKGDLPILFFEPIALKQEDVELLKKLIDQINIVLETIIPEMRLGLREYGEQLLDDGNRGFKVEMTSIRKGSTEIPIRMESEGIIKIISILNALIQAFSNHSVCLVVDELDAGIFEYLLGELLNIFSENAHGQLIFTSHNLRALELLDKDSIMFSTANPENRYIRFKSVKSTNNFRKMYLRVIGLGGQEESVYEETNSIKIARAFRKAGKSIRK